MSDYSITDNPLQKNNTLNRYLFQDLSVRGELVQLSETYQQIIAAQPYPTAVQNLLGELLIAASLLTATLKFEGSITLQLQGDGPVSLVVINGDNEQKMRGVARWDNERWQHELVANIERPTLRQLMGNGHLVITISPTNGQRYQGVVGLDGDNIAQVLESYFEQSEQLKTRLWIRLGEYNGQPHAAGMLLQTMPDGTGSPDDFEHLEQLTNTVKDEELFSLEARELLYRLYHQETVQLFEEQVVTFFCGCSRERSGAAIMTIGKEEIEDILTSDGDVSLHCDYCGSHYVFDRSEIAALYLDAAHSGNDTLH